MYLLLPGVVVLLWVFMWSGSPRVWPWFFSAAAAANIAVIIVFRVISPPAPADCDIMCFPWTATWIINGVVGLGVCGLLAGATAAIRAFACGGNRPPRSDATNSSGDDGTW